MTTTTDSFQPSYGTGITVAPTTSSAYSLLGGDGPSLVVTNLSSSVTAYVRTGVNSAVATTADYPVLPSTQVSLSKGKYENVVAYVTDTGTGSLHIMGGKGI